MTLLPPVGGFYNLNFYIIWFNFFYGYYKFWDIFNINLEKIFSFLKSFYIYSYGYVFYHFF